MKKLIFKTLLLALFFIFRLPSFSQTNSINYNDWQDFLTKYVTDDGKVNYYEIMKHKEELDKFINTISINKPTKDWTDSEQKAYWINAYNAFTVKLVLDNYPIKSLKDIKAPWDNAFIIIKGKNLSLKDIEDKILFKDFADPRIHFALCNASISGPELSNKAYLPETLDSQLNDQASKFINDKEKNNINQEGKVEISELFKWNKSDFVNENTSIIQYLNKFAIIKIEPHNKVSYKKFNWNLNQ